MEIYVTVTRKELKEMGTTSAEPEGEIVDRLDHKLPELSGLNVSVEILD